MTTGASALAQRLAAALGDGYELGDLVGRGGFAEVWRARERALDRDVAIKVLRPELAGDAGVCERFLREARAMARLAHPHIVQIHATGTTDGLTWVAMQFVEGESLRALLDREGALAPARARRILDEAAAALGAAHAAGIIHRDVKPDNMLLAAPEGRVLLTDFGIARAADATGATLTGTGLVLGTPHYMSPEQGSGTEVVDARADLYALGIVGYQMLAGRLPFDGGSALQLLMRHATEAPAPLAAHRPDAPPTLLHAIERCLRKRADDRWPTAAAFRDALAGEARASLPAATPVRAPRPLAPLAAAGAALAGLGLELLLPAGGLAVATGIVVSAFVAALWLGRPGGPARVPGPRDHRLRADRAAVLAMLSKVPRAEREALAPVRRALDDLVERADALAGQPASLDRARLARQVERLEAAGAQLRRAARSAWADGHARAAADVEQALADYADTVRRDV